jgi:signal transduction histidine kinase
MGGIGWPLLVWAGALFAMVIKFARAWWRRRHREQDRPVSSKAIRSTVINGALYGVLWGAVPVITFPGAPALTQLLIGCLVAGMMCAGGFVLATVPLAGIAYVLAVAAGAFFVLLQGAAPVYLGLTALMAVYTSVVIVNLSWNAFLFINHFLAEAQLQKEVGAREQAQALAMHAERMSALGQLAGGIAHDFNNTLQVVAGNAELIAHRLKNTSEVERLAHMILEAAKRGGSISRRLLAFARRDALFPEPVDPVATLTDMRELLLRTLAPTIIVRVIAPAGLPWCLADRRQLETVLLNLASNARDALSDGGDITFSAESETIAGCEHQPDLKPGCYLRLSVTDNGVGMDPATLDHAVEPFFTTKPIGKGTGLGLSMAKGFAEQSGGGLAISSAPDRGTTVTLWLPKTEMAATSRPQLEVTPGLQGSRHLLVVEHDPYVREVIMLALEDAKFVVVGADSGASALAHISSGALVDAMVTDFAMPDMAGTELVRAALLLNPKLISFVLTGHVGDIDLVSGQSDPSGQFMLLQKPIQSAQLARMLAERLN